ncbi:hypothetical protein LOAG_18658 [Loa loa]|uniref:Uncharacterized protein n=1 Tax=Loa loa TaxID=7209 RepID=A0A1S0UGH0_LOALO|nr:hypothetical protein LOAG_18658 [Loa loa]EJD73957.1 hypothetical protein LOAG_18658 [Loa loa]
MLAEKTRTVTAFIKEAAATSRARELLEKYTEPENWESRLPAKYTKSENNNVSNNYNTKGFVRTNLTSDEPSKIAVEQKLIHAIGSGNMMNNNGSCSSEDILRATQTVDKSSSIVISFNELNSISSIENGCMNTNKIAYIDEDERASDSCRSSNMHIGENQNEHINNGSGFKNLYRQGNSVQEIRALNDSDDDEVMMNIMSKVSKERENVSTTEANITADDRIQKNAETIAAVGTQGKHDDNPFTYSAGQLRLHGNRVGTYDMQKSRTLNTKRDVFTTADVSLIPANTSNSVLARDLIPAHFDGRETYARGLLDPTEDTRLNPQQHQQQQQQQQTNLDNEMANLKNQPDKCAIAKRRKENKKAKEAKNSYVVESKDGYMGNLSPEEILKRIEGENKGKAKGNQKNGTNGSKDHSSVLANGAKNSGGRKKGDKKDRQTDKAAKRSVIIGREVVELSTNMETSNVEKAQVVIVDEENKHDSSITGTRTSKTEVVTSSLQSDKVEEVGSGATTTTKGTVDEGVDDEEQYLSADEGANSNFSDDIYHTDEQSGASGSRDFISDGANYRADDEEINPLPVTSEESEFIQVIARNKRRGAAAQIQHQQQTALSGMDRRNVYFNSMIDRGARTNVRRDADRPRQSSVQPPPDNRRNQPSSRGNTSPSPVDYESFQKYSAPPRLRMLISEIIDNTLMKAQENKGSSRKGQAVGSSGSGHPQQQRQQEHSKFATSISMSKKAKYGLPSSLQTSRRASPDRRGSQPLTLKYSVAAGSSGSSPAVVSLSEGVSDAKRKIPEQHLSTVTVANTKAPAQRSWADIAKQRLYDNTETRPNEATFASSDIRASIKEERTVSGTSISGNVESEKKPEHNDQKRTVNVETVSSEPTVKDYSFFFDPNEPTGTVSKESEPKNSKIVPKETDKDSKSSKPRCTGMVLNLDGGRQVVIQESDVVAAGPPTIVDIRQRPEVETAITMWRYFMDNPTEIVTYREYKRQREKSEMRNRTSKEEQKKGDMAKGDKGGEEESK